LACSVFGMNEGNNRRGDHFARNIALSLSQFHLDRVSRRFSCSTSLFGNF
jgi:hypothetical protein